MPVHWVDIGISLNPVACGLPVLVVWLTVQGLLRLLEVEIPLLLLGLLLILELLLWDWLMLILRLLIPRLLRLLGLLRLLVQWLLGLLGALREVIIILIFGMSASHRPSRRVHRIYKLHLLYLGCLHLRSLNLRCLNLGCLYLRLLNFGSLLWL